RPAPHPGRDRRPQGERPAPVRSPEEGSHHRDVIISSHCKRRSATALRLFVLCFRGDFASAPSFRIPAALVSFAGEFRRLRAASYFAHGGKVTKTPPGTAPMRSA